MKAKVLPILALLVAVGVLSGCGGSTCYGVEPDGEVEKLRPCPTGWKNGEKRNIGEDQFKDLEVVDLQKMKNKNTPTVKTTPAPPVKVSTPKPTR